MNLRLKDKDGGKSLIVKGKLDHKEVTSIDKHSTMIKKICVADWWLLLL